MIPQVLLRLRYHLCHKLEPQKYYPLLRQMKVFDEADEQEVRHMITSIDKASLLLDKIQKRDDAYDILTKVCTRITSQGYILQLMEEKMRELTREESKFVSLSDLCLWTLCLM